MKVASIAYLHGRGGAERQLIMLSNYLADKGHEVHLVILAENAIFFKINSNVVIHDLTKYEKGCLKLLNRWYYLYRELNLINPDVSISFNYQSAYFEVLSLFRKNRIIVYSERGDPYDKEYSGVLGLIRSITVNMIDGFVFQSEGARDFFNNRIKQKSVVIHNPVSVPSHLSYLPKTREKRIVNVGRLHPQKNQNLLIDAFYDIHNLFPDYVLDIFGDGPLLPQLHNKVMNLGIEDKVNIHPSTNDIFDKIYNASLFVLTSDYEGMPNALMEAMALGIPCISTDCRPGGARTLIQDGKNGFIVPVGDRRQLAEKMSLVLHDPIVSNQLSTNSVLIKESHAPNAIFLQWEQFLYSLLN